MAAGYGNEQSVTPLLTQHADATARNDRGLNAADFARIAGRESLTGRLRITLAANACSRDDRIIARQRIPARTDACHGYDSQRSLRHSPKHPHRHAHGASECRTPRTLSTSAIPLRDADQSAGRVDRDRTVGAPRRAQQPRLRETAGQATDPQSATAKTSAHSMTSPTTSASRSATPNSARSTDNLVDGLRRGVTAWRLSSLTCAAAARTSDCEC